MNRRRKRTLIVALAAVAAVTAVLSALPEIARRAAVDRIPELTGRAVSIDDVDLNLITGSFAIKGFRLAEREGPDAFLEFERLEGRLSLPWLARFDIRFRSLSLVVPVVRIVRTGPESFNFSDLLALVPAPDPAQKPSRWTVSVDALRIDRGRVIAGDRAVSPAADWSVSDLAVDLAGASTRAGRPPGRAQVRAQLGGASVGVDATALSLAPLTASPRIRLTGFDLARLRPYVPAELPVTVASGTLAVTLEVDWRDDGAAEGRQQLARGEIVADGLALVQRQAPVRIALVPRIAVRIRSADLVARAVAIEAVEVDGLDLAVTRRRDGSLDVLASPDDGSPRAAPVDAPPPDAGSPAALPPERPWRVVLERLALREGRVLYVDETFRPARETRLDGLAVEAGGLSTSPLDPPGRLSMKTSATVRPGDTGPFALAVDADALRLDPLVVSGQIDVSRLDLRALAPVLAEDFPVIPTAGRLDVSLRLAAEEAEERVKRADVSGTVRLAGVALSSRGGGQPFARVPKLDVAIRRGDLLTQVLDLEALEIQGVAVRAARDAEGRIDLLALAGPPPGAPARASRASVPSEPAPRQGARRPINEAIMAAISRPWRMNLERLAIKNGRATLDDRAVTPPQTWRLARVTVDGARLSTGASPPGRLRLRSEILGTAPGPAPATLALDASSLRLTPLSSSARVALKGLFLPWVAPYVPEAVQALPSGGVLAVDLSASVAQGKAGLGRAVGSGTVALADLALTQRGAPEPFLKAPSVAVVIQRADAVGQTVHLSSVEVDAAELRGIKYPDGRIDLLELSGPGPAGPGAAAAPPPAPATAAPSMASGGATSPGAWSVRLDRFDLRSSTAAFEDRFVHPVTLLSATDLTATVEDITWPVTGPTVWKIGLGMPGGGRSEIEGTGTLDPLAIQVKIESRDLSITPYDAYFPFPARFRGLFSGDSVNEIEYRDGVLRAASRGTAWGRDIQVWGPGRDTPDITTDRLEIRGIDFAWPNYALVEGVTIDAPRVQIERGADGAFNLRRLFEVTEDSASAEGAAGGEAAASPAPAPPPAAPAEEATAGEGDEDPAEMIVIDFKEIAIDGGYLRFLDRTTAPPFSQEMSAFRLRLHDLSNVLGRQRTTLTATAVVGGDGALDLRGEISGLGETLRADLVGELRDYTLATANPYADSQTSWIVERGKLAAKIHYRVEGDVVTAENELTFGGLHVRRSGESDEVKKRIGLPLGLIVGLLKDTRGDINFNVPLRASVKDQAIDWTDTVWSGVKQAVLKVLAGSFRAIGRAFRGGGGEAPDLAIDPVVFATGSAVIAPAMETHLTKVADFLRRSPYVAMTLRPVVTEADVESLKTQALTERLQAVQQERKLKDLPAALAVYYRAQKLPGDVPKTPEEQLAVLQKREPVPAERVDALRERRLAVTREVLAKTEGIATERLVATEPAAALATSGEGRVEFSIGGQ
ncbi:MAG TPA: DUF748 domain-containing protein [Candidatus Binatia bacterium]|nr:DUF748 domain-containing protein [Candidatus Binatia bacterium]